MIKRRIIFYSIFILILGFLWLILTTSGLRFSFAVANLFLPGKINIQEMHGSLAEEIYINNLTYQHEKNSIFVQHLQLHLNPIQLLTGKLKIKSLQAHQIIFQHNNKPMAQLDQLQLQAEIKSSRIKIQQLAFSSQFYIGYLFGESNWSKDYQTNLNGQITALLPNKQATKLSIKINGNLSDKILLQINTINSDKLKLNALLNYKQININGHWNNLSFPLDAVNSLISKSGLLKISGDVAKYNINAHFDISSSKIPTALWNISGNGNTNKINLDKININTLGGKINAKLNFVWNPNLVWQLNLQTNHLNPAVKWPGLQGDVNGNLIYHGSKTNNQRNFTFAINNLYGHWRHQMLHGVIKVTAKNDNIFIEPSYLRIGNNSINVNGDLNHRWRGNLSINAPNLAHLTPFTSGSLSTNLQISGVKNMPQLKGSLKATGLKSTDLHIKHLIAKTNIELSPHGITNLKLFGENLNYHLLHYKNFNLNLSGRANEHTLQVKINTKTGAYTLKLIGDYNKQVWHATLQQLDLQATNLGTWHLHKPIAITAAPNEFNIHPLCLRDSGAGKICGELKRKNKHLTGKINIDFPYLSAFATLMPQQVNNIRGTFKLNAEIAGSLAKPSLAGNAKIINTTLQIKPLGMTLRAINLAAIFRPNNKITFEGSAISRFSKINISGISTFNQKFSPTQINIDGKNILLVDNKDFNIIASPQLKLSYYYPTFIVGGKIFIPHALITLKDYTAVTTLPDNTMIITSRKIKQSPYKYYLDITAELGNDIKIDTSSLNAKLIGKLTIKHSPLQPITATGKLSIVDGKYNMRGRLLQIDQGDLMFINNPINNPRLNFRASKTITAFARPRPSVRILPGHTFDSLITGQHLVVGIRASGTLQHPRLKLFSEPPGLSDANVLSYLILGTSSHQATENQTQMLYQTAQLMGVGGTNAITGMQSTFGLTDFGIEEQEIPAVATDQAGLTQPAFGVGKYLTPKLYMHYSVGISNPISIFNLTYYISHLFTIQTETSSVDQGADIFYTFETS